MKYVDFCSKWIDVNEAIRFKFLSPVLEIFIENQHENKISACSWARAHMIQVGVLLLVESVQFPNMTPLIPLHSSEQNLRVFLLKKKCC